MQWDSALPRGSGSLPKLRSLPAVSEPSTAAMPANGYEHPLACAAVSGHSREQEHLPASSVLQSTYRTGATEEDSPQVLAARGLKPKDLTQTMHTGVICNPRQCSLLIKFPNTSAVCILLDNVPASPSPQLPGGPHAIIMCHRFCCISCCQSLLLT